MAAGCEYTIGGKTYSEKEFKNYLLSDGLKTLIENGDISIPDSEAQLFSEKRKKEEKKTSDSGGSGKKPPAGEKTAEEESDRIGITHADTEAIRDRYGLGEYERTDESFAEWDEQAAKRIREGGMQPLLDRLREGQFSAGPVEQRMMLQYIGVLDDMASKKPSDENLSNLKEAVWLNDRILGSEWGKAGVARRGWGRVNFSLASMLMERMEETAVDILTPGQKAATEILYKEMLAKQEKMNAIFAQKEIELAQREAKLKVEEMKKKAASTKRTAKDIQDERKTIIDDIAKKWADAAKKPPPLYSLPLPIPPKKLAQLQAIAPDVLKLARNYFEGGVKTLEEVIEKIKEALSGIDQSELEEPISSQDINSIIAGSLNKRKPTKNELQEQWEDLRQEAKYIDELYKLESGVEPVTEKAKEKKNQKLKDIGDKIKKHPLKVQTEQRKADEKRIEELQDRLDNLNAGVEPKINAKEKREVSDEIKELQDKIKKHDLQRLAEAKRDITNQQKKIQSQIDRNEFADPKKDKIQYDDLDEEGKKAYTELAKTKREWKYLLLQDRYRRRTQKERVLDNIGKVLNISRSAIASSDFSAILNQGIIPTLSHPTMAVKAIGQMWNSVKSQDEFNRWHNSIEDSPRWDLVRNKMKVRITDPLSPFSSHREDQFNIGYTEAATDYIFTKKYNPVRLSERAYVQFLNKMRWDLTNELIDKWEDQGKTYKNSKRLYEWTGQFINDITGSANLPFNLEQYAGFLNGLFFSPRMLISRIKLLSPYYLVAAPKELRAEYAKEMGKSLGLVSAVMGAFFLKGLSQSDDDPDKFHVELDPRSSDFFKIRQGNTRWNPLGGFQSIIRATSQFSFGSKKSTTTGLIQELGSDKAFGQTRGDVVSRFFRSKLSPSAALIWDLVQGEDMVGDPVTLRSSLWDNLVPLTVQSIWESWKDYGALSILNVGFPNFVGVGSQTYEAPEREIKKTINVSERVDGISVPRKVKLTDAQYKEYEENARVLIDKYVSKLDAIKSYKEADIETQVQVKRVVESAAIREAEEAIEKKYKSTFPKMTEEEKKEVREKQKTVKDVKKELNLN